MRYGFTGTSQGMTVAQRNAVRKLFQERLKILHVGDCVGADAEAYEEAIALGAHIVGHPPLDPKLRAFCDYRAPNEVRPPKKYLARNKDIVEEGRDGLIAAPRQMTEPRNKRGEGTWTTIGYARDAGRRIWIVLPDGTVQEEPARQLRAPRGPGSGRYDPHARR